jgi:tetratricopeptide (TPR) repeat protein
MPPKRKDFLKPNAKAKAKAQEPQSENEFLEAADEFEQAAGKWRAGDAAKATRFFNRAIDMYNTGLQRYPNSFDLAYNKANLEYNMSEDDRIVAKLGNKISLLEETLKSHRTAISLNPDNTDVQFNTAQVLTSLAETLLESGTQESAKAPARILLEEAVDIFTKCLASQQQEYEQIQIEIAKANALQEGDGAADPEQDSAAQSAAQDSMETSSTSSDAPGQWATVVEPVSPETILETCSAQLGALSTLVGLYDLADLPNIEAKAQSGLDTVNTKIPALINLIQDSPFSKSNEEPTAGPTLSINSTPADEPKTSPKEDAVLAAANFQSAIAEATYRSGQTTTVQYAGQIEQLFTALTTISADNNELAPGFVNALSSYADALIELASAVSDNPQYSPSSPSFVADLEIQWKALTQAQTILTKLSSAPYTTTLSPSRIADVYLARGDTDLFRLRISLFEGAKPAWVKSKNVLVGNAGVFYRGARTYAEKAGSVDVHKTADVKAVVAEILKEAVSGSNVKKEQWKGKGEGVVRVLEQMVEEGIIGKEDAEGVVRYL